MKEKRIHHFFFSTDAKWSKYKLPTMGLWVPMQVIMGEFLFNLNMNFSGLPQ
jgi:hypothetical protein